MDCRAWKPFCVSRSGPKISYLLFADGMFLFAETSMEQLDVLRGVVKLFSRVSEHKISIAKTNIYFSKNVGTDLHDQISTNFGFIEVNDLRRYLGVPLIHTWLTKVTYSYLIKKIQDMLSGWQ
ncbi:hypothetical protein GQ457_02G018020 [Hibiscus cannabinus]